MYVATMSKDINVGGSTHTHMEMWNAFAYKHSCLTNASSGIP